MSTPETSLSYPEIEGEIPVTRSATVLFCDEIRREDNGKFFLIGVYLEDLLLPKFPAQLAPIQMWLEAITPRERPFGKFVVRAYLNDREVFNTQALMPSVEETQAALSNLVEPSDEVDLRVQKVSKMRAHLTLPPLLVEHHSRIRVRIETEEGVLKAGVLTIKLLPSE